MSDNNYSGIAIITEKDDLPQNSATEILHQVIEDILNIYVPLFISLCGIVCNLFNISIFWKLGLKDSMSINVFALSVTDFLTTFLQATVCLCYLAGKLYPASVIDTWALGYFAFQWMVNAIYLSSCWITAVITIEKCFCVVFPFKVKQIFTRFRSVMAIIIIYFVHIGLHVPIYVIHKMEWVERPSQSSRDSNFTETKVRVFTTLFVEETARVEKIFDITVSLALSDVSFIIVIVCTVWMARGLKASSEIRAVASSKTTLVATQKSNLSNKERKLIKVAVTLAITLSVCGLPRVLIVSVQSSIPNGNISPIPWFILIMWAVAFIFTTLGSSITIFVYLMLNSNYRAAFCQCFQRTL